MTKLAPDRLSKFILRNRFLLITMSMAFLFYVLSLNSFQVGIYMDDAVYVVLAKSLSSGYGYSRINFPDNPPELKYPFGFPLLLAPLVRLFPQTLLPLKLLSLFFTLASIYLCYLLFRNRVEPSVLTTILLLFAFNPGVVAHAGMVMSEASYLFFTLLAFLFLDRFAHRSDFSSTYLIMTAFCMLMAYFVRTIGIVLFVASVCHLCYKRDFKKAITLGIVFALVASLWAYRNVHVSGTVFSAEYEAELLMQDTGTSREDFGTTDTIDILIRPFGNLAAYVTRITANTLVGFWFGSRFPDIFVRFHLAFWLGIISTLLFITVLLGFLEQLRKGIQATEIYVMLYSCILLIWPWRWRSGRFLLPVLPFLYLYLITGLQRVFGELIRLQWFRISRQALLYTVTAGMLLINLGRAVEYQLLYPARDKYWDLSGGTKWIRDHTPKDSVIMCLYPESVYLYANRQTVGYPVHCEPDKTESSIHSQNVDYVLVQPEFPAPYELNEYTRMCLEPVLMENTDSFRLVHTNQDLKASIYQVLHDH